MKKNRPAVEVSKLFDKSGVLSYLDENAEVLHTQGRNFILGEIKTGIRKKSSAPFHISSSFLNIAVVKALILFVKEVSARFTRNGTSMILAPPSA